MVTVKTGAESLKPLTHFPFLWSLCYASPVRGLPFQSVWQQPRTPVPGLQGTHSPPSRRGIIHWGPRWLDIRASYYGASRTAFSPAQEFSPGTGSAPRAQCLCLEYALPKPDSLSPLAPNSLRCGSPSLPAKAGGAPSLERRNVDTSRNLGPNEVPTKKARNPHGQGATNTTCLLPEVLNSSSLSTLLERRFSPLNARICFWRLYLRHELGSCGQRACLGGLREPTARTGGHQGAIGPRWPCFPRVNRKGSAFLKGASPGGKRAGAPGCLVPTPPHSGWGCRPPATPHLCTRTQPLTSHALSPPRSAGSCRGARRYRQKARRMRKRWVCPAPFNFPRSPG